MFWCHSFRNKLIKEVCIEYMSTFAADASVFSFAFKIVWVFSFAFMFVLLYLYSFSFLNRNFLSFSRKVIHENLKTSRETQIANRHLEPWSKRTPMYFTVSGCINLFPSRMILRLGSVFLELEWKIMNSVFMTWRDNLLALSHWDKFLRSEFICFAKVSSELCDRSILVSSAKW